MKISKIPLVLHGKTMTYRSLKSRVRYHMKKTNSKRLHIRMTDCNINEIPSKNEKIVTFLPGYQILFVGYLLGERSIVEGCVFKTKVV